jgi:hypothetical protein
MQALIFSEVQLRIARIVGLLDTEGVIQEAGRIRIGEVRRRRLDPIEHVAAACVDVLAMVR